MISPIILDSISELRPFADDERWRASSSVLLGSAATLAQARILIENGRGSRLESYQWISIVEELSGSWSSNGIHWDSGPNLRLWSIGYFLNSGEQRVAAGLEKCLHMSLSIARSEDLADRRLDDQWISTALDFRVKQLAHDARWLEWDPVAVETLDALYSSIRKLIDTEDAADLLGASAEDVRGQDLETLLASDTIPISNEDAVALTCARVNSFKHRARGLFDRFSGLYELEWLIASRGLLCVTQLCTRLMRSATASG